MLQDSTLRAMHTPTKSTGFARVSGVGSPDIATPERQATASTVHGERGIEIKIFPSPAARQSESVEESVEEAVDAVGSALTTGEASSGTRQQKAYFLLVLGVVEILSAVFIFSRM